MFDMQAPVPTDDEMRDELSAAKGVLLGCALSIPLWVFAIVAAVWL